MYKKRASKPRKQWFFLYLMFQIVSIEKLNINSQKLNALYFLIFLLFIVLY